MRELIVLSVSAAVLLGACSSQRDSGSSSTTDAIASSRSATTGNSSPGRSASPVTTSSSSSSVSARTGVVITIAASPFGPVLFDRTGQAIYTFDTENTSKPRCYGECADAWPPVLTTGRPIARGAVRQDLLGVTTRSGGTTQATYGGKPLYFYAHEGKHQVLCHNVTEFGGRWLAITAAADPAPI